MSNVNHPSHYASGKIEVIEAIEDWELGFHLGNAIKYVARAGKKDPSKYVEDLEKAVWYIKREIELLNAESQAREPKRPNDMNARIGVDHAAPGEDKTVYSIPLCSPSGCQKCNPDDERPPCKHGFYIRKNCGICGTDV